MARVTLGARTLEDGGHPYVIAEIGVNHEGSMDTARRLIDLAREGGADAAKFQSYKAERIASKDSPAYWDTAKEPTPSQFALFRKYDTFEAEDYARLAEHCRSVGIEFMSTPFDAGAVKFLDPLVRFFKVASADITNVPLLRQVAAKGKPVVLSTGASSLDEIEAAAATLRAAGCRELVLLHCVLNYPCPNANANLNMIAGLKQAFPDTVIGYSDHTQPDAAMQVMTAAWLRGATVLEKHFTHDKDLPGNDHYHAMDVDDLKRLIANLAFLEETLGSTDKQPLPEEASARENARRSIVTDHALAAGAEIGEADITCKRPGSGISPARWDEVVGRRAKRDLAGDHILRWEDLT